MLWGWEDHAPEDRSRVLAGDVWPLPAGPPRTPFVKAVIDGS